MPMTKEQYERLSAPLRARPNGARNLRRADRALTLAVYCAYPALLLVLLWRRDPRLLRVLLTPGLSFVLVSLFRRALNAPRPYEALDIVPLIPKDTKGQSFPSRHVFSVFVIAATFLYCAVPLGLCMCAVGILIAAVRVLGGVHYPKDVLAGAAAGLLSGLIGFVLIP